MATHAPPPAMPNHRQVIAPMRWLFKVWVGVALGMFGVAGCAAGGKPLIAPVQQVSAVDDVLAAYGTALVGGGDAQGAWSMEVAERIAAVAPPLRPSRIQFSLVGLRVVGDTIEARVRWSGDWPSGAGDGLMQVSFSAATPIHMQSVRGDDPADGPAIGVFDPAKIVP